MARGRGRRTDYEWASVCGVIDGVDLAVTTSTGTIWTFAVQTALTVMRMRGELYVQLDATAVDERALIAYGIGKGSTDAITAGAVPDPVADQGFPWIWFGFAAISSLAETAVQPQQLAARLTIDSKAMRKMKPQESLFLVGQVCAASDQGGTFDTMFGVRVLTGA